MTLSFTSLVGMDTAKQALLLLAVNPALAGVAMAATVGSGKSTLARAYAELMPDDAPFVELPVNVTEDRLIGGLDMEATLVTGQRVIERGVLARAHGGALYADGLNLLDASVVAVLMETMANGVVRIEREGLSATHVARFVLVGTYDTSDGELRRGLLDRIGMIVPFAPLNDAKARVEIVRRNEPLRHVLRHALDTEEKETEILKEMILAARVLLPRVQIADEQIEALVQMSISMGVEGNRADVFAVQAALAKAALDGRTEVDDDDLKLAMRLVLVPRAMQLPEAAREEAEEQRSEGAEEDKGDREDAEDKSSTNSEPQIEELLLEAAQAELPADILTLPFAMQRKGKSGSRGVTLNNKRGRFVSAVAGAPRGNRVALVQTLLAAAPWQRLRRIEHERLKIEKGSSDSGVSIFNTRFSIHPSDVRIKRYRDKAGMLYIFVVDASGSMAINRMREAKGAAIRLLQDAYVHRDQVALISFRGQQAQVLLEPSQSVERAKRELDVLPTGGGTPLASALLAAWQTARLAKSKGVSQATLVIMTDGRGNIPLYPLPAGEGRVRAEFASTRDEIQVELQKLASLVRGDGINAVVVDTQANYLSRGEAPKLAQWLGGRYVYLPNAKAEQILGAVK